MNKWINGIIWYENILYNESKVVVLKSKMTESFSKSGSIRLVALDLDGN